MLCNCFQVKGLGNTLAQSAVLPAPYKGVADVCSRVIKDAYEDYIGDSVSHLDIFIVTFGS
jgi:hypothetical protein